MVGAKPKLKMGNGILGMGIPKIDKPSSSLASSSLSITTD